MLKTVIQIIHKIIYQRGIFRAPCLSDIEVKIKCGTLKEKRDMRIYIRNCAKNEKTLSIIPIKGTAVVKKTFKTRRNSANTALLFCRVHT